MSEKRTSVAIRADLVDQMHKMNIDPAAVAERALFHKIIERRSPEEQQELARKFQEENAEAFEWANEYFEKNGFPFPQYGRY